MDYPSDDLLSYTTILSLLREGELEDIIRRVLGARGELPEQFARGFEEAVLSAELKGLASRRALEAASEDRLVRALLKQLQRGGEATERLYAALLSAWIWSQSALALQATQFLSDRGLPPSEIRLTSDGFQGVWARDELNDLCMDFLKIHGGHAQHDVAIMLCCLAGRAPVAQEAVEEVETAQPDLPEPDEDHGAEDWLNWLSTLPADLGDWEQGLAFALAVQQVAQEKLAARERSLDDLLQAVAELQEKREWFGYFHLDAIEDWPSRVAAVESPRTLAENIRILSEGLEEYEALRAQYPNPTFTGDLRVQKRQYEVGNKIRALYLDLEAVFRDEETLSAVDLAPRLGMEGDPPLQWDDWLRELGELPESDPFWDAAAAFCTEVLAVVETKQSECSADAELADALAALQPFTDLFDYFGLSDLEDWSVSKCAANDPDGVATLLTDLSAAFALFRERQGTPPAATFAEEQAEAQLRRQTAEEIVALYEALRGSFALGEATAEDQALEEPLPPAEEGVEDEDVWADDVYWADESVALEVATETEVEPEAEAVPAGDADAEELQATPEDATALAAVDYDQNDLLWELVATDDLAGAYWIAESMAAAGHSPVPSWLLAATQASRWLHRGYNLSVENYLTRLVRGQQQPGETDAEVLLSLAAALRPTLFAPSTGMIGWLGVPDCCPEFHPLTIAIQDFANYNIALGPDKLLDIASDKERERTVAEAALVVQRWLDNAPTRRFKYRIASDVWLHLVTRDGALQRLLAPVAEDRREDVHAIQRDIVEWMGDYDHQIDEAQRDLKNLKTHRIMGGVRQSLHRAFDDACQAGLDWCELVLQQEDIASRGDWIKSQVEQLVEQLGQVLPPVVDRLSSTFQTDPRLDVAAAARAALRTVAELADDFRLATALDEEMLPAKGGTDWLVSGVDSVDAALSRRLLLVPEIQLSDDGRPVESALPDVAGALARAHREHRTLHAAFRGWLERQDFRFADRLISLVRDGFPEADEEYAIQFQGAVSALAGRVKSVEEAIEQALVDGVISSEDAHSRYNACVVSIHPSETRDFFTAHQRLHVEVEEPLAQAKQQRLQALEAIWQELEERLDKSNFDPEERDRIRAKIADSLARGDTRIVDEYLSGLRDALDGGQAWITADVDSDNADHVLDQFLHAHSHLVEAASRERGLARLREAIEKPGRVGAISFHNLPAPRRSEALAALDAWRRLKKNSPSNRNNSEHMAEILRYLGFTIDSRHDIKEQSSGSDGWLYVQASMDASPQLVRPLPQFGSQRSQLYDVVAVWERPSFDTMSAWLHDLRLTNRAVILLYFGRMSLAARRSVAVAAQEQGLTVATLDEVLLLFLATPQVARGSRLPAFLRCALPFAAVNPYTPYKAGDVPPEMFFGRQDMARELLRLNGSCLVYGGRQLGKSALLRHVQREFHDKERQHYARVEDIRLVGDPIAGQPPATVFVRLRDALKAMDILSKQITTDNPDRIREHVLQAFAQNPHLQIIMMFDEADSFLEADSREAFGQVWRLREIMDRTDRRFKVILAGLQHVQRFQGIPNQPLAHFGVPLRVGPLEPRPAQQLVKEPLEAIGYRIDRASVLRILSYTNYHPGLIQLFCHEMLGMLHARTGRLDPPYEISQEDVEAVYRRAEVRDAIRERFNLTLALDKRYEAIACAMIVAQMEMHDSYAQSYPPGDILRMAQGWWPQGFGEVSTQEARARLDEMCGLGVLVRDLDGHYRLKSPNLVRLMGAERDIEDRLLAIATEPAPIAFDADHHHAWLDEIFSPFTYSQERSLSQPRFGVSLVFASDALGYEQLPLAYARLVEGSDERGLARRVPQSVATGDSLRAWLDRFLNKNPEYVRFAAYYDLTASSVSDLPGLLRAALEYCQRRQHAQNRWLKVIFSFDSAATWQWLSLPHAWRDQIEDEADAVVTPERWTELGIKQRLQHRDAMDSRDVCRSILTATGGWHVLVDRLFDEINAAEAFDPRPTAEQFRDQLMGPEGEARTLFLGQAGLEGEPVALTVAREIKTGILGDRYQDDDELSLSIELTSRELAKSGLHLTPRDVDQALAYLVRTGCAVNRVDLETGRQYVLEPVLSELLDN